MQNHWGWFARPAIKIPVLQCTGLWDKLKSLLDWIPKLLGWLGKPALVLGAVVFFCGSVLWTGQYRAFDPANKIAAPYLGFVQLALLAALALLLMTGIAKTGAWVNGKNSYRRVLRVRAEHLHNLTYEEKAVLREYLHRGSKTAKWLPQNGVVCGHALQRTAFPSLNLALPWPESNRRTSPSPI
jgi:hypothetical protein